MSTSHPSPLGTCPRCGGHIPTARAIIEYETADSTQVFAECPDCRDVVHPVEE